MEEGSYFSIAAPHFIFDILACASALLAGLWQKAVCRLPDNSFIGRRYIFVLLSGCALGGYVFGTWNVALAHQIVIAHSVLGALTGGIIAVELYKAIMKIRMPTGAAYALPFCVSVAVGRVGCFIAGLDDMTCGTPTTLPWAIDFGDGIPRHPVQLYESFSMAFAALLCVLSIKRYPAAYLTYAFPATVGFYALQRFLWEFLKPYAQIIGDLNLFHLLSLALMGYSCVVICGRKYFERPVATS